MTGNTSRAPLRIAIVGNGRMGKAVALLAAERGFEVVAELGKAETRNGIDAAALNGAQMAIEFTVPGAAVGNVVQCIEAGVPVVTGTTGWYDRMGEVEQAVAANNGRVLYAPNFSLGVQLFLAMVEDAGRRIKGVSALDTLFDMHIVETHHARKLDAPSGTAMAVEESLRKGAGRGEPVPVTSVRTGYVPGTHSVLLDAPFEQITLSHEARDRRVFADGALHAARWLASQGSPGLYTMRDVINSTVTE